MPVHSLHGRAWHVSIGIFGGLMNKLLGMHAGVQFMAYYTAALFVPSCWSDSTRWPGTQGGCAF